MKRCFVSRLGPYTQSKIRSQIPIVLVRATVLSFSSQNGEANGPDRIFSIALLMVASCSIPALAQKTAPMEPLGPVAFKACQYTYALCTYPPALSRG